MLRGWSSFWHRELVLYWRSNGCLVFNQDTPIAVRVATDINEHGKFSFDFTYVHRELQNSALHLDIQYVQEELQLSTSNWQ